MKRTFPWIAIILGLVFLAVPLASDSYNHYLQNRAFIAAQEQVVTCRARVALQSFSPGKQILYVDIRKLLDGACGIQPGYDDFAYTQSGVLSLYNWIGQKITFIPL
jgi:hypothetical protein